MSVRHLTIPGSSSGRTMGDDGDGSGSAMQFLSCGRLFIHALNEFNSRIDASISSLSTAIETVESRFMPIITPVLLF
jgi:hypothetical protein